MDHFVTCCKQVYNLPKDGVKYSLFLIIPKSSVTDS